MHGEDDGDDALDDDALNDDAAALAQQVLSHAQRPIDWNRLSADEAPVVLAALDTWVRRTVDRYSLDHRDVPPCWFRHAAIVEELSALRTAHIDAFHPAHPPSGPAEWHTIFGNTRARLRDWTARTGCKPDAHRENPPVPWAGDDSGAYAEELSAYVADDQRRREAAEQQHVDQLDD